MVMSGRGRSEGPEGLDDLEEVLKALSSRNRLRLISELRRPQTVDEIRLTPAKPGSDGKSAERQLTRQGVRHHLSKLEDAGLVRSSTRSNSEGRDRREYVINEPAVYSALEKIQNLVSPGTEVPLEPFQTEAGRATPETRWDEGPKLVLLRGAEDDRVFDLQEIDPIDEPGRGWVIGRSPSAQISLQYDPYLSSQNTELLRDGKSFQAVALRTSRNGTVVNDRRLDPGSQESLEHGDVLRVGCSALVFHER